MKKELIIFWSSLILGILVLNFVSAGSWQYVTQPDSGGDYCSGLPTEYSGTKHCGDYFNKWPAGYLDYKANNGCGCWLWDDGSVSLHCCEDYSGGTYKSCLKVAKTSSKITMDVGGAIGTIVCTPRCTPRTCQEYINLNPTQCGRLSDNCGSYIDCFTCPTNFHCSVEAQGTTPLTGTCLPNLIANIKDARWENLKGQKINSADKNDTVGMVFGGAELAGKTINYQIQRKPTDGIWNLWNLFGLLRNWDELAKISGDAKEELYLSDSFSSDSLFRFNASTSSGIISNTSNDLEIKNTQNNFKPIANLTSPSEDFYAAGQLINFNHTSYDEDDLLYIEWKFSDGTNFNVTNYSLAYTPGKGDLQAIFEEKDGGQFQDITLTAKEMTRTQSSTITKQVYILKRGINVIPKITSPKDTQNFNGLWVFFNASASSVLNCSNICEIGRSCEINVGDLKCYYLHRPYQKTSSGYELIFNWTLITPRENDLILEGSLLDYEKVVNFNFHFDYSSSHQAILKLTFKQ